MEVFSFPLQIKIIVSSVVFCSLSWFVRYSYASLESHLPEQGYQQAISAENIVLDSILPKEGRQLNHTTNFPIICTCTRPKEIDASLSWLFPMFASGIYGGNRDNKSTATASSKVSIAVQCQRKNFECRKWKRTPVFNPKCHFVRDLGDGTLRITEVYNSSSCTSSTVTVNPQLISGHLETINNETWHEKSHQKIPIIKIQSSNILIIHNEKPLKAFLNASAVHFKAVVAKPKTFLTTSQLQQFVGNDSSKTSNMRKRRSSQLGLKPMIFPRLNPNLVERKRNTSSDSVSRSTTLKRKSETKHALSRNEALRISDFGGTQSRNVEGRRKREMHVMLARYRKEIKRSRNSRKKLPKTTRHPNYDKDNCAQDVVSTTPYTFLNVSFTGYWERKEKVTTVKPRIQKPLKMDEKDLEFVYGGGGYENQKPTKKKNKGKSGGWSSKLEVTF